MVRYTPGLKQASDSSWIGVGFSDIQARIEAEVDSGYLIYHLVLSLAFIHFKNILANRKQPGCEY